MASWGGLVCATVTQRFSAELKVSKNYTLANNSNTNISRSKKLMYTIFTRDANIHTYAQAYMFMYITRSTHIPAEYICIVGHAHVQTSRANSSSSKQKKGNLFPIEKKNAIGIS